MTKRDGYEHGVPSWVDISQPDPEAAVGFYATLLGWEADRTAAEQGYVVCRMGGRAVAGIAGPAPQDSPPAWNTHVWVSDADDIAARAQEAGGRVLAGPNDTIEGGRYVAIADPAGATIVAWQPGDANGAELVNEPGSWAMSMLTTPDPEGAKAFYAQVFGWEADAFGDGGALFRVPGYVGGEPQQPVPRDVVAVMQPGDTAVWAVDFRVDDPDAAAATAPELGGAVVVPPFDTPFSRNAVLADPHGAVFSVSHVGPRS